MPISIQKASFNYPSARSPALDSVDLTVECGEIIALAGSSGSGKTTLAKLMCGLLFPTSGDVEVDGFRTCDDGSSLEVHSRVGLVFQNPDEQMVCQTVEREIAFTLENLGMERDHIREKVNNTLLSFDIVSLSKRQPSALSGGERSRVALASTVVVEPSYLVLDEPTSLLDAKGRELFYSMLKVLIERGLGVILLTQYADEALLAERLVVLNGGKKTYDGDSKTLLLDGEPEQHGFWRPKIRRAAEEIGVWKTVRDHADIDFMHLNPQHAPL